MKTEPNSGPERTAGRKLRLFEFLPLLPMGAGARS